MASSPGRELVTGTTPFELVPNESPEYVDYDRGVAVEMWRPGGGAWGSIPGCGPWLGIPSLLGTGYVHGGGIRGAPAPAEDSAAA